jgi:chaperonin GroEL (HSP60 family)
VEVMKEHIGIVNIIKKVLSAPIKRLVKNAGLESVVIIAHLIKQNDKEIKNDTTLRLRIMLTHLLQVLSTQGRWFVLL